MAKREVDFSLDNPENAAAAGITPPTEEEPTEGEEETQVLVGEEPPAEEPKPDIVTLTPQQFAELKAQSDSAKAIREGIEGLSSRLAVPQAPLPANSPVQTAEEFLEENGEIMFDSKKGPPILKKFVKMVADQEYGPAMQAQALALQATKKELLEARDPNYKRYAKEVEALVASQPPVVRLQPNVYELAWNQIRQQHAEEISSEEVSKKVDEAVAKKLKELGIDPDKPTRPPAHVNSAARSTPAVTPTTETRKTVRLPDKATETRLREEAKRRGLDFETLLKAKGYMSY